MARLGTTGDRIIIMAFVLLEPSEVPEHRPRVAILDRSNQIVEMPEYPPVGPVTPATDNHNSQTNPRS
jgi:aspartate 1-decarboxylase